MASFTKEVHPRLPKRPQKTNGRLLNRGLTSIVKEATDRCELKHIDKAKHHSRLTSTVSWVCNNLNNGD